MADELTVNKPPAWLVFAIGARHSERLESQINFFFCWMVVFAGLVNLAINIYQSMYLTVDTLAATASSVSLIMFGVLFHVVGRRMQRPELSGALLIVLAATLICLNWLSNQGTQGSLALWFSPLFMITASMLRGWLLKVVVSYLTITIVISMWLEWSYPQSLTVYGSSQAKIFDISAVLVLSALICFLLSFFTAYAHRRERSRALKLAIEQLKNETYLNAARLETDQLRSLLPICAWCKKIETTNGTWSSFEFYLSEQKITDVTHGMCPSCLTEAEEKEFD
ncbi:MAG: hypothetical protein OSA45_11310 [Halioglobus sp.]|nr:hypothetical protein [Halioglobus sp.]